MSFRSQPHAPPSPPGSAGPRVRRVSAAEFAVLRDRWDALLARSARPHVFLSWEWLFSWWECFQPGRELFLLAAEEGGRLVGLLPLLRRRLRCLGAVPYRRLEFLGSGEREAEETCTEYLDWLLDANAAPAAAEALAEALAGPLAREWDDLLLQRAAGPELAEALRKRLPAADLERLPAASCPFVPLPDSFSAYLESLSANSRQQLRRALRRLEGRSWTLEEAETPARALAFLRELVRLHGARWSREGRAGAFASPRFRRFHERVVPRLAERGWVSLLRLRVDGETAGCLYNLRRAGAVAFYQSGVDLDRFGDLKPGLLLHALAIRQACERGDREYDFLGGAQRYKQSLAPASRPLTSARLARGTRREPFYRAHAWLTRAGRAALARAGKTRRPVSPPPGERRDAA